jgi:hypothetical protein
MFSVRTSDLLEVHIIMCQHDTLLFMLFVWALQRALTNDSDTLAQASFDEVSGLVKMQGVPLPADNIFWGE